MKVTIQLDSVYDEELDEFYQLVKAHKLNGEIRSDLSQIYIMAHAELKHGECTQESLTKVLEEIRSLANQE